MKHLKNQVISSDWDDFCGHSLSLIPIALTFQKMNLFYALDASSLTTRATLENCTTSSKITDSPKLLMLNYRPCGLKHTIKRLKNFVAVPLAQSTSIVCVKNTRSREPFGTESRKLIVSKNALDLYFENGIFKTPTQIQPRRENWLRRLASLLHKLATGLRIDVREIEQQPPRTSKL